MAGVAAMWFKFVQFTANAKGVEGGGREARRWRINCLCLGVRSSQVNGGVRTCGHGFRRRREEAEEESSDKQKRR